MYNQTFITAKELATETIGYIEERYGDSGTVRGIKSGFKLIDRWTQGFQKGNLITISSYSDTSHILFMMQMIFNIAVKEKTSCGFFSYTMNHQLFGLHMLSRASDILLPRLSSGMLRAKDIEIMNETNKEIFEAPLVASELYTSSFEELCNAIRRQVASNNLKIVFIDSLNSIPLDCESGNNKSRLLTIVKKLKILAMELNISIVAAYYIEDKEKEKTLKRKTDIFNIYVNVQLLLQRKALNQESIYQDYSLTAICNDYWLQSELDFILNNKTLSFEEKEV